MARKNKQNDAELDLFSGLEGPPPSPSPKADVGAPPRIKSKGLSGNALPVIDAGADAPPPPKHLAEIAVEGPVRGTFTYVADAVWEKLVPGARVEVPFGRQTLSGFFVGERSLESLARDGFHYSKLKAILRVLDQDADQEHPKRKHRYSSTAAPEVVPAPAPNVREEPSALLTPTLLELARWMSRHYAAPLGSTISAMLPAGVKRGAEGIRVRMVSSTLAADELIRKAEELSKKKPKQAAVLLALAANNEAISAASLLHEAEAGESALQALEKAKLVQISEERPANPEHYGRDGDHANDLKLNDQQQAALDKIEAALKQVTGDKCQVTGNSTALPTSNVTSFLLQGVTGSGKTEVYLRALKTALALGRQAIVLVPEIALTPQTAQRFENRLGRERVAVLHSHVTDGDRAEAWRAIRAGKIDVVVGARSALFAPLPRLGIIVIDEEHENAFKQESTPRYHARDVAMELARLSNAVLVLGSATPSFEALYLARKSFNANPLPPGEGRRERSERGVRADGLPHDERLSLTPDSLRSLGPLPGVEGTTTNTVGQAASGTQPTSIAAPALAEPQTAAAEPVAPLASVTGDKCQVTGNRVALPMSPVTRHMSPVTNSNSQSGPTIPPRLQLLQLTERVAGRPMPPVEIIDMNRENTEAKRYSFLSRRLVQLIGQTLQRREQTILFMNRRGFATVLTCLHCGNTEKCAQCDITLTSHRELDGRPSDHLSCHYCNFCKPIPDVCAVCGSPGIKHWGMGTERIENEVKKAFPSARVTRMDSDTMKARTAYLEALGNFRAGKTDILVGTQMIAKGLDFPNVTLVGVVLADTALHMPDFRSRERTFQLLAQVAGRAGRGEKGGRVLIQTHLPNDPAIRAATQHDFETFSLNELQERRAYNYPPYMKLARILIRGKDHAATRAAAVSAAETLRAGVLLITKTQRHEDTKKDGILILGPAEPPINKLEGYFRQHILIKAATSELLSELLSGPRLDALGKLKGADTVIDVDAVSML